MINSQGFDTNDPEGRAIAQAIFDRRQPGCPRCGTWLEVRPFLGMSHEDVGQVACRCRHCHTTWWLLFDKRTIRSLMI
jgi:hypothetical protein